MSLRTHAAAVLFALTALVAGCGGSGQSGGEAPAGGAAPEAPPPLPGESAVTGKITFMGTAPAARMIQTSSDPLCSPDGSALRSEVIVVGPGNELQNVFVYVKDGLGDRTFQAPKTPVVLDQVGCRYTPHVSGAQVGQPVEIVNSDPTLHNVHAVAKANNEFNFSQPIKGDRRVRTFDKPE